MIIQGDQVQLPEILLDLTQITSSNQPLYLVGGAVRDYLLGRSCKDYDIVCSQEARKAARNFADQMHGAFFTLDEARQTYRVLIGSDSDQKTMIDFATMRGNSIEEDLAARDFTINAMAIDLNAPNRIIDPHKGGRDLQEKWLRPVSADSFTADPLRVIRAIRYAVNLDLKLEPETSGMIRSSVGELEHVSAERKRDELFKILDGKNIHTSLSLMQHFHVLEHFPLLVNDDFARVQSLSRVLEELLGWLTGTTEIEKQAAFHQVSLFVQLQKYEENFREHFLVENSASRTRKALLFLTALLDTKSDEMQERNFEALALSVEELNCIMNFHRGYAECARLLHSSERPTAVEIYDFYRLTASSGVDLVVSNLAEYRTRIGAEFSNNEWLQRLTLAETLLKAWWEQPELIRPVPLLDGDEIIQSGQLPPGPIIGEILEALVYMQIAGSVKTKKEAFAWLASWLDKRK